MANKPFTNRLRPGVIAEGALLILGCPVLALSLSQLFYWIRPARVWGDRTTVFVPSAPLISLLVFAIAIVWARRAAPTTWESAIALTLVELVAFDIVFLFIGSVEIDTLVWWSRVTAVIAIPWFLASVTGRVLALRQQR